MASIVGAAVKRVEDPRFLTGATQYVDDVRLPGTLAVAFVRSPHARARIRGIDASRAAALPGVVRVLLGEEVARRTKPLRPVAKAGTFPGTFKSCAVSVVAVAEVGFVGEIVAAVVAESRYVAEDAAELVEVDWEPLKPVVDAERALEPGSPLVHPEWGDNVMMTTGVKAGDPDGAFAAADVVVKARLRMNRHCASSMEGRAVLAAVDRARGQLTLWTSSQSPHVIRTHLARTIGHPEHLLRVIAPDVGGGFGLKANIFPEEIVCALAALDLGRPVKWIEDRRENLTASYHAKDIVSYVELAARRDGTILGLRGRFVVDAGADIACPWTPAVEPFQLVTALPGPYKIANVETSAVAVATNTSTTSPYRGVGLPAAQYAIDHIIDMAAAELGLDPAEVRRRNILTKDEFPYTAATGLAYDSATPKETLELALAKVDYAGFRRRQAEARREGRWLGIGVSSLMEMTGLGWELFRHFGLDWLDGAGADSAHVRMDSNGTVTLSVGTLSHGQGHATVYAQLVADTLGIRVEDVTLVQGDTRVTPFGWGTWGSRSTVQGGGAVLAASGRLREKILRLAGHMLEVAPQDLELADGAVTVKGVPTKRLALAEVAYRAVYGADVPPDEEPGLEAVCHYKGPTPYANATHVAEVEVDPETGRVQLLRYVVIEDCGRMINPMIVEGQLAGGIAQGVGNVLFEHLRYDEAGQPLTTSFMDYLLPTAADVPPLEFGHLETPSPLSESGLKGMGEGGAVGPPAAVANAIADALAPLGGWRPIERLPATPEVVRGQVAAAR
ncbi:MAG TPA: xanthine dehydrogenase family protein molybdopterin-binding subunit [Candidatus Binatia bacterium]|nr:xanthine dehydrogenase family protein molybdopterin-binding subunit [Candidatus Binatia bacterium]